MAHPKPDGWKGGGDEGMFVTTQRGHITFNAFDDSYDAACDQGNNAVSFDDHHYGDA